MCMWLLDHSCFCVAPGSVQGMEGTIGCRGSVYLTSPETSSWLSLCSYLIYNFEHGELRSREATSQDWSPWTLFSLGLCGDWLYIFISVAKVALTKHYYWILLDRCLQELAESWGVRPSPASCPLEGLNRMKKWRKQELLSVWPTWLTFLFKGGEMRASGHTHDTRRLLMALCSMFISSGTQRNTQCQRYNLGPAVGTEFVSSPLF